MKFFRMKGTHFMTKPLLIAASVALALSITACGREDRADAQKTAPGANIATPSPLPPADSVAGSSSGGTSGMGAGGEASGPAGSAAPSGSPSGTSESGAAGSGAAAKEDPSGA